MLPLVHRELRSALRARKFYAWRVRVAVVEILAAAMFAMFQGRGGGKGSSFWFLAALAFIFCLFEGHRKTSDCISEEKREGTLGFLFLTDLHAMDIVLGKLAGALFRSFCALLAFVPILSFTLLLGGTTLGEFWRVVLVLIDSLWFSLAICLLISTLSRERNLTSSIVVLVILVVWPWLAGRALQAGGSGSTAYIAALSPLTLFTGASEAGYLHSPSVFWLGLVFVHLIGWAALFLSAAIIPRIWRDKPNDRSQKIRPRVFGSPEVALARRTRLLDQNPMLWLAYNERRHRWFNIVFFTALLFSIALLFVDARSRGGLFFGHVTALFILSALLFAAFASQASRSLAEAKKSGAMELLLSTPLKVADMIAGQWLALRKIFLLPATIVFGWYLFLLATLWFLEPFRFNGPSFGRLLQAANFTLQFLLGFFVLGWLGMWMGLTAKTANRAFIRTVFIGMILPAMIVCIPTLLIQLVLLFLAMDKVKYSFRRFIAHRYLQSPEFILAPLETAPLSAPPVIRPDTQFSGPAAKTVPPPLPEK
jgi:ABC-type transport system involved in multi-copper enzyme maturation permease subunit